MPTANTPKRVSDVTEKDFLDALVLELQAVDKKPYEFTINEIMAALSKALPPGKALPGRHSLKSQLDNMVDAKPPILSSRQGWFATPEGRRKQWAYTILNAEGKSPEDIFPNFLSNKKPAS